MKKSSHVDILQDLKLKDKAKLKITEENNCQELKLEHITYLAMHQQYRSCIKFQRSLSDYFTKWMKCRKYMFGNCFLIKKR